MTQTEALKMALDALRMPCNFWNKVQFIRVTEAISAAEAALEQQSNEQVEPVAWMYKCWNTTHLVDKKLDHYFSIDNGETYVKGIPLYTHPPVPTAQPKQEKWLRVGDSRFEGWFSEHTFNGGDKQRAREAYEAGMNDPLAQPKEPEQVNCCPDCGCHFTGSMPFNYEVKPEQEDMVWKLVPVKSTREIEDAIGNSRNLKASEIWEDALAAVSTPPQRKPLTDEQIIGIARVTCIGISPHEDTVNLVRAIEAAHGIKE